MPKFKNKLKTVEIKTPVKFVRTFEDLGERRFQLFIKELKTTLRPGICIKLTFIKIEEDKVLPLTKE